MVSAGNEPSTSSVGSVSEQGGDDEGNLFVQVVGWVLTAMLLYGAAFWVLGWIYSGHPGWPGLHDKPAMYDLARSSVGVAGILGGAAAIAVALRRQRSTEKSVRIAAEAQQTSADAQQTAAIAQKVAAEAQRIDAAAYQLDLRRTESDRVTALRARYTEAARQLGDSSAAVRLAGAYAMAALADDWITRNDEMAERGGAAWIRDPDAQACIDVLCAYIRTPRRYAGDRVAGTHEAEDPGDDTEERADREVRQTIIRITRDHLLVEDAPTGWGGFDLDYTGAVFHGSYSFADAEFAGGEVSFSGARFRGGEVSFDRAKFTGGMVNFSFAVFAGGQVRFAGAEFAGTSMGFIGAKFLGGAVSFAGARFTDGVAYFFEAAFARGEISFRAARFAGAEVSFKAPEVTGPGVVTGDADFTGGEVSFQDASWAQSKAFPEGPWRDVLPPWPPGTQWSWPTSPAQERQ